MRYKDYIDAGFVRTDMDDEVEFKETGYRGFTLTREINGMTISLSSGELDKPKLYIKKQFGDSCHIYNISPECVRDLIDAYENGKVQPMLDSQEETFTKEQVYVILADFIINQRQYIFDSITIVNFPLGKKDVLRSLKELKLNLYPK